STCCSFVAPIAPRRRSVADRSAELAWSMGMLCPMVTRLRQLRPRTFHRWTFLGTVCRNAVTPTRRRMSLAHHANCRTFPTCVPRCFCPFLLERLAMWPRGHISNRMRSASFGLRLLRQCERPCCTLAVVGGCTVLFMVGAILAYDPSRGFLARRGEPGGGT